MAADPTQFKIYNTNYCTKNIDKSCKFDILLSWIKFLNEQSIVRFALCEYVNLNERAIRTVFLGGTNRTVDGFFRLSFQVGQNEYVVSEDDVNRILKFPTDKFSPDPSEAELVTFFQFINYQNDGQPLTVKQVKNGLMKKNFTNEWRLFFDLISHAFAPKTGGYHGITQFVQKIGYAVAYNRHINFGKLILQELLKKMNSTEKRCIYPRFIQLFINSTLSEADKLLFDNTENIPAPFMPTKSFSYMQNKSRFEGIVSPLTPFMQARFNQPPLANDVFLNEQAEVVVNPQEHPSHVVEEAEQPPLIEANFQDEPVIHFEQFVQDDTLQGESGTYESNPFLDLPIEYGPPVATGKDQEIANPQSLTQILEPNTESNTSIPQPLKRKEPMSGEHIEGETGESAANKEVLVREPTALPPQKKSRIKPEATVCSSVSSQQDTVVEKANEQSLVLFSQQSSAIEIRPSARVPCNVSNPSDTVLFLQNLNADISKVLRGNAHTNDELLVATVLLTMSMSDTTIVGSSMNQVPSQALEGNLGTLPLITPSSTLPDPTPPGPFVDVPHNGRQSTSFMQVEGSEKNQMSSVSSEEVLGFAKFTGSNPISRLAATLPEISTLDLSMDLSPFEGDRQLVFNEVGDSRNPIAPSVTSLEGAMMISHAGTTTQARSSKGVSETLSKHLSETLTPKPSEIRNLSEILAESVSETPTNIQNTPEFVSRTEFEALNQRVHILETENGALKDESIALKHEFERIKDEMAHMKSMFLSGMSSQTSQALPEEDPLN